MSGSRTPEVTTGYRGPKGEFVERSKTSAGLKAIPEGKRIFQASHGRYRLQLTAPNTLRLTDGRIIDAERPKVVQFEDYQKMYDVVKDKEVIELIEGHKHFNIDFWDLQTKLDDAKEKKLNSVIEFVASADPDQIEVLKAVLAQSGDQSFGLTPKTNQ